MKFVAFTFLFAALLFVGMLICYEIGWRFGRAKLAQAPEGESKGVGAAVAGVFGLLGLIMAFSFYGAAGRFEARRHLITEEANAIGTAYLRLDLVPEDAQPELRDLFRKYTDLRAVTYLKIEDRAATKSQLRECAALQTEIWKKATAACLRPGVPTSACTLLLGALNVMIDVTTTREMATRNHPPMAVFLLLAAVCLATTFLVGYDTPADKRRNWPYIVTLAAVLTIVIYVTVDLEFPHLGLIRVNDATRILVELQQRMN